MAVEKTTRKTPPVVSMIRNRMVVPQIVLARAFHVIEGKHPDGLIDILLEGGTSGRQTARVVFDGIIVANNPSNITTYLAEVQVTPSATCQDEKIAYAEEGRLSNLLTLGRVGNRAETMFGLVSLADLGSALRAKSGEANVDVFPILAVQTTLDLQVALVSEILRVLKP